MNQADKHNVLGVLVSAIDYQDAVEKILDAAHQRKSFTVSATAVHGLMTGVLDRVHRYRLNRFDLLTADGQPVRWALNGLHRAGMQDRVYGPNLMLRVCEAAAEQGLPVLFFGGESDLLAQLQSRLSDLYPNLKVAGTIASEFRQLTDQESEQLANRIRESGAAIVFVGIGCPRQEVWAFEHRNRLPLPVIAVGAAFAFHAGVQSQAPAAMQKWGLEWLYRLVHEPKRLWQRYVLLNPLYVVLLCLQATRLKRFDPADSEPPIEASNFG